MFKFSDYQKRSRFGYQRSIQTKALYKATRATFPETGRHENDLYNRQYQTPEFALTLFLRPSSKKQGQAKFVRSIIFLVSSPRLQEKSCRGKMALIAVEAVPAGGEPLAAVGVSISAGERHGFGASAPLSTRASSMDLFLFFRNRRFSYHPEAGQIRRVVIDPRRGAILSPFITRSAAEAPSVRLRVFVSGFTSASVSRHGCRASCSRPAKR